MDPVYIVVGLALGLLVSCAIAGSLGKVNGRAGWPYGVLGPIGWILVAIMRDRPDRGSPPPALQAPRAQATGVIVACPVCGVDVGVPAGSRRAKCSGCGANVAV